MHRTYMGGLERGELNLTLKSLERIARRVGVEPLALMSELAEDPKAGRAAGRQQQGE